MMLSYLFIHYQHKLQQQYDTETCVHEANYDTALTYLLTYCCSKYHQVYMHNEVFP